MGIESSIGQSDGGPGTAIPEIPIEAQTEQVSRDLDIMHRTGEVPRWARFFKADSF